MTSFVHIAQKPADHGPHSRFFQKVNPFQNLFTIYSHFQSFPGFPKIYKRAAPSAIPHMAHMAVGSEAGR